MTKNTADRFARVLTFGLLTGFSEPDPAAAARVALRNVVDDLSGTARSVRDLAETVRRARYAAAFGNPAAVPTALGWDAGDPREDADAVVFRLLRPIREALTDAIEEANRAAYCQATA